MSGEDPRVTNWAIEIVDEEDAKAIGAIRELWTAYWQSLGLPSSFQGFAAELRALPGKYRRPAGCLLLARVDSGLPVATAALRPLDDDSSESCEAKRLYVHPNFRRRGIAAALLNKLIEVARDTGYRSLYGDTLPTMSSALALYREFGFVEVGPYSADPTPNAIYMRLSL